MSRSIRLRRFTIGEILVAVAIFAGWLGFLMDPPFEIRFPSCAYRRFPSKRSRRPGVLFQTPADVQDTTRILQDPAKP